MAGKYIDDIGLMKINIEGGEYELLERMIELGIINKVKDIQIQFHCHPIESVNGV